MCGRYGRRADKQRIAEIMLILLGDEAIHTNKGDKLDSTVIQHATEAILNGGAVIAAIVYLIRGFKR
jgi:hypothetical protein